MIKEKETQLEVYNRHTRKKRAALIVAALAAIAAALFSAGVGSRPFWCSRSEEVFLTRLMLSTRWTGMRMVRPWSAMARVMDWRIHQVA